MNRTPSHLTRISCAAVACLFLASCGGGSQPEEPKSSATDQEEVADNPAVTLSAATPEQDIERLRILGYQVFLASGEASSEAITDPAIPQAFPVAPEPSASAAAAGAAATEGRVTIMSADRMKPMVVGGALASPDQFNFAVYLRSSSGACTGSLIAPQWVKTAAHCVPNSTTPPSVTAVIGSHIRGSGGESINADYVVRLNNDTLLVHLERPSIYGPVAYNGDPAFEIAGTITTLGYGQTSFQGLVSDLKFVDNSNVARYGAGGLAIGTQGSYLTTCFGDSGGPNLRYSADGFPVDIATTSATFAPYCTGLALAYSTSYLASFIEATTGVPPGSVPSSNAPPVVPSVPAVETSLGSTVVTIPASDPEGKPLSFRATGLPSGLQINSATGVISGTTTEYSNLTPSTVVVTVTDSVTGARRSVTFPWRVNTPGNGAPVFATVPAQTSRAGSPATLTVSASDPDSNPLTYTATGLPPGLVMSTSGHITGSPNGGGTYQVNVYANDLRGGMGMSSFPWTILNTPPTITLMSSSDVVGVAVGGAINVQYETTDADSDAVTVVATGLPTGVTLDTTTKTIRGSVRTPGVHNIVLNARDPYGGSASTGFTLAVMGSFNRPPTMNQLVSRTDAPGVAIAPIPLNPVDLDGHSMTVSFTGLPTGIRYDARSKSLIGTPGRGGVFTVNYSIYDAYGATTLYEPITWTIPNQAPTIVAPVTADSYLPGVPLNLSFTASDPDGHPFTVTATGLPKGLIVNTNARAVTGSPLASGEFQGILTAKDRYSGTTVSAPFSIYVPNSPPVIGSNIGDMTTVAGTSVSVPINVSDPENHKLLISVNSINVFPLASSLPPGLVINSTTKTISGKPSRGGTYTVVLKVADIYGAYVNMPAFTWTIVNTKPVLQAVSDVNMRIGVPATSIQLSASDPENHGITYKVSGLPTGLRVSASGLISGTPTARAGTYKVTAYARDAHGLNSDTVTFYITLTS